MGALPLVSTVRSASTRKRLWLAGGGLALFLVTCVIANGLVPRDRAVTRADLGHDFLAFYTGAAFVREGRAGDLYNLDAVRQAEQATAHAAGVELGSAFGPWWNPPFYALALEPLAALPYRWALDVWRSLNVVALVAAALVLGRIAPARSATDRPAWLGRSGLILLLMATSMPFIQAIGHAQNTCTSLLLLAVTVSLWRAERAVWAGVVGGLLFYKPQLAAVLALVMAVDLGGSAIAGFAVTGAALLLVNAVVLPGTLTDWLHRLPANVRTLQVDHAYLWDRHVTLKSFWRLLIQGTAAGRPLRVTAWLTNLSLLAVALPLAAAAWRARGIAERRDRLITAALCATPLLMPFYFDYDLLLLAVPAALYAADVARDRRVTAVWSLLAAELFVNAPLASNAHVAGAVVVLTVLTGVALARVNRARHALRLTTTLRLTHDSPIALAA